MKLKFILLFSLIVFLSSCADEPQAFHFGPGPMEESEENKIE